MDHLCQQLTRSASLLLHADTLEAEVTAASIKSPAKAVAVIEDVTGLVERLAGAGTAGKQFAEI